MKRLVVVVVLVLLTSVGYHSLGNDEETGTGTLTLPQPAPTPGERAPTFTAQDRMGRPFSVDDNGVYVLTFWSTLNQGSNQAQAGFERLAREYGGNSAKFAAVYVGGTPKDGEHPYTILQDSRGRLTSLYLIKRVPRLFLIRGGDIILVQNQYFEENERDLEAALKESLEKESKE